MADTKKILLGVCGGIAAYKTAMVVSRLVQDGHDVQVVMTESATKFVGKATFQALTGKSVITCTFDTAFPLGAHIELAREYDLLCIAPATANMIGKMAHGISEELMSTLYLCFQGNVLLAPAMNCEMWEAPAVQRNVNRLEQDGVRMIGPNEGWLSCRVQGR
ncbi:MAG: flavoprotein [Planctomycetota bacterium]